MGWKEVAATSVRLDAPILAVTVSKARVLAESTESENESPPHIDELRVTGEHPFWIYGQGWVPAKRLKPGDRVSSINGGTVVIQSVRSLAHRAKVYNLNVEDFHTYHVGSQRLLVHNTCDLSIGGKQFGKTWAKHANDYGADASSTAARKTYKKRIKKTFTDPDETRVGPWHPDGGGGKNYKFRKKGDDLLVTDSDDEFVTMFPDDGSNSWWKQAKQIDNQ